MAALLLAVTGLSAVLQPDSGLRLVSLEGVYILQDGPQALVIGSGRSDYAGQTAAQYLRANGVTDYTLLIPEGKMAFTGGSFSLLTQFPGGPADCRGERFPPRLRPRLCRSRDGCPGGRLVAVGAL